MVNIFINEHEPKLERFATDRARGADVHRTMFVYSATMANVATGSLPWYDQSGCGRLSGTGWAWAGQQRFCLVDYHRLARWSFVAYWATILSLLAVLVPAHRHHARLGRAALD